MGTKKKTAASRAKKQKKQKTAVGHSQTAKDTLDRRTEIAVFTLVAYAMLRGDDPKEEDAKYRGLHTVWTGHNTLFREFFPDEDPVECQNQMVEDGLIITSRFTGGALLQPTINLLTEPTADEKAIAERVRKFIPVALEAYKAKQAAYKAKKANGTAVKGKKVKRSAKEQKADSLMAEGNVDKALKTLGW